MSFGKFLQKTLSRRSVGKGNQNELPPLCNDDSTLSSEQSTNSKASLLHSLAQKQCWKEFLAQAEKTGVADSNNVDQSTLLSDEDDSSKCSEESSAHNQVKGAIIPLHIALAYRPPLSVVESIISGMKSHVLIPEEMRDERGLTPLHVAASHFAGEEVIVRLLQGESLLIPAVLRDNTGRTPLHCAAGAIFDGKRRDKPAYEFSRFRAMQLLLEEYPEAVYLSDDLGKTPVDYGKEQRVKNTTMSRMQFLHKQTGLPTVVSEEPGEGLVPNEVCESFRCHAADDVKSVDLFLEDEQ